MTTPNPRHETLWHLSDELVKTDEKLKELSADVYERRADVWALLYSEGVEQKSIAERSGVDPSDVSRALSERNL